MKTWSFVRYGGAVAALTIASACGNASPVAPSGAGALDQYVGTSEVPVVGAHPKLHAMPGYPVIAPDGNAKSTTYEYIIDNYYTYAGIFNYPKSDRAIGYINDVGGQGCTNVLYGYGNKIAWIVAASDNIAEYSVPKTKLRALSDSIGAPSSCAMDSSGDLAVGILDGIDGGYVIVYKNASGSGTKYPTALSREYFDGYDPQGNLFADGLTKSYMFLLVELPKGKSKVVTIKTSNKVNFPGSVQWDGTYLTLTDQETNEIYQYTVKGTKAILKGTVKLVGAGDCAQTWNAGNVVYCADAGNENGSAYNYPAGGAPIATFTGNFDLPLGTTAAKP
jgi:hypothetical protein